MTKKEKSLYSSRLRASILQAALQGKLTRGNHHWKMVKGYDLFEKMESKKPKGDYFDYIDTDAVDNKTNKIVDVKHLPCSSAPSRASRGLQVGDVLFSKVRPYLRNIALVEEQHKDCIATTGFFVCRSKLCTPKYLFYMMLSPYVVDGLMKFMKGDNSPSINEDNIKNFEFPVPPTIEEQKEIANKVEALLPLVEEYGKAEQARQNLEQKFPSRLRASILQNALQGHLTRGNHHWIQSTLGEMCADIVMGQSPDGSSVSTNGDGIEFHQGKICFSQMYLKESEHRTNAPSKIAPAESVLLCVRAPVGKVNITKREICIGRGLCALVPPKGMNPKLLYYFLSAMEADFIEKASGSTFVAITAKVVREMPISYPPSLAEQEEIVGKVEALLAEVDHLTTK